MKARLVYLVSLLLVADGFGARLGAQSSATPQAAAAEAGALAQGWTMLARGDAAGASSFAQGLLAQYPKSSGVLINPN